MNDYFEEHALRHEANAVCHVVNGHPEYAIGSLRKAARWRSKKLQTYPCDPLLERAYAITREAIADNLFNVPVRK